jgi:DNA-binding GntR family transcriptional regulator
LWELSSGETDKQVLITMERLHRRSAEADQPETVVEYTISALRDAIRDGRVAPGQRLVVADITKMLGVSNGPVREAIRRLTGEGLVEIIPHRGASVREFTRGDVHEIFQLREVIEGLAARLAAEKMPSKDYRVRLQSIIDAMAASVADGAEYINHNQTFHELIYEMASNVRVQEQARQLTLPLYRLRYHWRINPEYAHTSATEHEGIAQAIIDGDGRRAERLMRRHIRNSGTAMLSALEVKERPLRARA